MFKTPTDLRGATILTSNFFNDIQRIPTMILPQSTRWFIYILFVLSNILISFDHGSIPASTKQLHNLVKSDQAIGLFGSLVFIGNIIGAIISFYLINKNCCCHVS